MLRMESFAVVPQENNISPSKGDSNVDQGLLKKYSVDSNAAATRVDSRVDHGLLKDSITAATKGLLVKGHNSPPETQENSVLPVDPDVEVRLKSVEPEAEARQSSRKPSLRDVKLIRPGPKWGGVLDIEDEPKPVRICVLGVKGRVLYLEAYKNFVDLLLNFLTMRAGAVIKLVRQVEPLNKPMQGGIFNVYQSLLKLNNGMVIGDKQLLLDPLQKLKLSEELESLNSFEAECCNAECPKYVSGSRVVCKNCTISNHFSCSICGAYFRDNVHTTMCSAPWRPWGTHIAAAPVLDRYTVIQSGGLINLHSKKKPQTAYRGGIVKPGIPFMITNELLITPLTTRSINKVLKSLDDSDGKTGNFDCHELFIGKTEVVILLGAAMTSLTPLNDVFAKMCNSGNKISNTESLSGSSTFLDDLTFQMFPTGPAEPFQLPKISSIKKPLEDLMTYVRPLASGFKDAIHETTTALQQFSELQPDSLSSETSKEALDNSSPTKVVSQLPQLPEGGVLWPEAMPNSGESKQLQAPPQDNAQGFQPLSLRSEEAPPTQDKAESDPPSQDAQPSGRRSSGILPPRHSIVPPTDYSGPLARTSSRSHKNKGFVRFFMSKSHHQTDLEDPPPDSDSSPQPSSSTLVPPTEEILPVTPQIDEETIAPLSLQAGRVTRSLGRISHPSLVVANFEFKNSAERRSSSDGGPPPDDSADSPPEPKNRGGFFKFFSPKSTPKPSPAPSAAGSWSSGSSEHGESNQTVPLISDTGTMTPQVDEETTAPQDDHDEQQVFRVTSSSSRRTSPQSISANFNPLS